MKKKSQNLHGHLEGDLMGIYEIFDKLDEQDLCIKDISVIYDIPMSHANRLFNNTLRTFKDLINVYTRIHVYANRDIEVKYIHKIKN